MRHRRTHLAFQSGHWLAGMALCLARSAAKTGNVEDVDCLRCLRKAVRLEWPGATDRLAKEEGRR